MSLGLQLMRFWQLQTNGMQKLTHNHLCLTDMPLCMAIQPIFVSHCESRFMVTWTSDTALNVLFCYKSRAERRMMWTKDYSCCCCLVFFDVISSVQPHLPNTVLSKMSFWGEIHISSTQPRIGCRLFTQSALQTESRSDKHVNLTQHSRSVTNAHGETRL